MSHSDRFSSPQPPASRRAEGKGWEQSVAVQCRAMEELDQEEA